MSAGPPAPKGTMIFTALAGKSCADAALMSAPAAAMAKPNLLKKIMESSLAAVHFAGSQPLVYQTGMNAPGRREPAWRWARKATGRVPCT